MRRAKPAFERLMAGVEPDLRTGCHLWQGALDDHGYGRINLGRRGEGQEKTHRLAWAWKNGPVPDGLSVLHSCDTPRCCNPDHLFLGTQLDNMRDMVRKGRHQYVECCGHGHPWTQDSTAWSTHRGKLHRYCLICSRERERVQRSRTLGSDRRD